MAKKRANGEGSIRKRSSGIWEGRVTIDGVAKSIYGKTQADVRLKLTEIRNDLDNDDYIDPSDTTAADRVNDFQSPHRNPPLRILRRQALTGCPAKNEYFGYSLGALEYRAVRVETELLDKPNFQGNAVVNYTDRETPWTRIIEHKWIEFGKDEIGNDLPKTVISQEFSSEWKLGGDPYYPVNDIKNGELYKSYVEMAGKEKNVIFGGRLAEYRYYDMDQVVASALYKAQAIIH